MTSQPSRLSIGVKRKINQTESVESGCKKVQLTAAPDMGEEPKRANFSALTVGSNGTKMVMGPAKASPGGTGVKKIVIKSMKELPKLPDNYQVIFFLYKMYLELNSVTETSCFFFKQEVAWKDLEEAVVAIQHSTSIRPALEDLYQAVQNLCSHNFAPLVYSRLKSLIEEHVRSNLSQFTAESASGENILMLTSS